jgi:hypothetical protein
MQLPTFPSLIPIINNIDTAPGQTLIVEAAYDIPEKMYRNISVKYRINVTALLSYHAKQRYWEDAMFVLSSRFILLQHSGFNLVCTTPSST